MKNLFLLEAVLCCGLLLQLFVACELEEKEFIKPVPIATEPTDVTEVSFSAHWHKVLGAELYLVDVATSPDFKSILTNYSQTKVTDTFLRVNHLKVNTTYFFRVGFKRKNTLSAMSEAIAVKTKEFDVPLALPATQLSQVSLTANWQAVAGAESYWVELSTNPAFENKENLVQVRTADTLYVFENLEVFKTYYYRVKAVSGENLSAASKIISTQTTNLTKPVLKETTEVQHSTFKINWDEVYGATSYLLDVSTEPNFMHFVDGYQEKETAFLSETITNLEHNSLYYFRIKAKSNKTISEYSDVSQQKTTAIYLATPEGLAVEEATFAGFKARWNASADAENYVVSLYYDENINEPVKNWEEVATVATEHDFSGLEPSTDYFFVVKAKGLGTISEASKPCKATTSGLPLPVVQAATNLSNFGFTANWEAVEGLGLYEVQLSTDANFSAVLQQWEANENAYQFSNLVPNKAYYYRVRSKKKTVVSAFSEPVRAVTLDISRVQALAATVVTPFSFTANWQKVAGVDEYVLQVSTDSSFTRIDIEKRSTNGYLVLHNLLPHTTYNYRVLSVKDGHISAHPSNRIAITTSALGIPTAFEAEDKHAFGFTARWTAVDEATVYEFSLATDSSFNSLVPGYANRLLVDNFIHVQGLDYSTTYYYRVRAKNATSYSAFSSTIEILPMLNQCQLVEIVEYWAPRNYRIIFTYNKKKQLTSFTEDRTGDAQDFSFEVAYSQDGHVEQVRKYKGLKFNSLREVWTATRAESSQIESWEVRDAANELIQLLDYRYDEAGLLVGMVRYADVNRTKETWTSKYAYVDNEVETIYEDGARTFRMEHDTNSLNPLRLLDSDLVIFIRSLRKVQHPFAAYHNIAYEYWKPATPDRLGYYYKLNKLNLPDFKYTTKTIQFIYNEDCATE